MYLTKNIGVLYDVPISVLHDDHFLGNMINLDLIFM
jgi:hypothetical protein